MKLLEEKEWESNRYAELAGAYHISIQDLIDKEQMGVIKDVHLGIGDYGTPAFWFTLMISEYSAALQVESIETALQLIDSFGVRDVHDLNGKHVWAAHIGNCIVWTRPCKVK